MSRTDVVIVGAGAAGLSLAHWLTVPGTPGSGPGTGTGSGTERGTGTGSGTGTGGGPLDVTLVEAPGGPLRPAPRTWCYWEPPGGPYDHLLTASWDRLRVRAPDGSGEVLRTDPLRYKMLRSTDFEAAVGARLARVPWVRRVTATVDTVVDSPGGAEVVGTRADGSPLRLRARWVLDSRPPRVLPPARTVLLQHFRGWFVTADDPVFRPGTADLMDFRTPQPDRGLSFGYVLPTGPRTALVEYTEFSPGVIGDAAYDRALRHYLGTVLGIGRYTVTGTEHGVIPMTDARLPRRTGASVFPIGAAGGATRPATGYTFAGTQRQTRAVAAALRSGRTPLPPPAHGARSRAMDAVLLRALDTGRVGGADFFARLFRTVPTPVLLRFLDGGTGPVRDVSIGLRTPVLPMLRTALELPLLRRRPHPGAPAAPASPPPPTPHREGSP
ncbi:lycopene cyclase [Streptomyces sp. SID4919]|uniref:lycopene cyclase family protein n=1 Tax=unclassified Streptomyces TaxID=2593676 RepID=UPI0008239720|nr:MULTISPECIES: lycopene cyclase family protein [unclassified Streptomyces]MYY11607.1 lycopene cyclase [Streptomyces sp. SID4919]SCK40802.1 lycopene beta-cyclase [Streptomyces sp. AmelKG-E11A]